MPPLKNQRQELFCQYYFSAEFPAYECALKAGYALKSCRSTASALLTIPNIQARLSELNEAAASARVMSVQERLERLSEIGRGKLTDFLVDGKVQIKGKNLGAIATYNRTEDRIGENVVRDETELKLIDPVRAIQEINKMTHVYEEKPTFVNQVNIVEVVMVRPEPRQLDTQNPR